MSISEAPVGLDADLLREALASANIPTLVPVLYQLTGDSVWLAERYQPTRPRGTDDHDDGGLPPEVQEEIRQAVCAAVLEWEAGRPPAVPAPTGELLLRLASISVGEPVPAEYESMTAEQMGFRAAPRPKLTCELPSDYSVLIVGAGISGMTAAKHLIDLGITPILIEKNARVGGTWIENRYPGCGVDTPSFLYSLSFFPWKWSGYFGKRPELEQYLTKLAEHFDLCRSIRFNSTVERMEWDAAAHEWAVTVRRGDSTEVMRANLVISAVGQLNIPKIPTLDGIDTFEGPAFHSACWPDSLDVTGKRVAVVGAGASAMQIVPAVVDRVAALDIYQRSPQWIMANSNYFRPVDDAVHWLRDHVPFYREWYRFRLAWAWNDRIHDSLQKDPDWPHPDRSLNAVNDTHRAMLTKYIERELAGRPDLIEKAVPTYPPFGKRMLQDNGWYASLKRPHVDLIPQGVRGLTRTGVLADDGTERPVDVVVFATGFRVENPVRYDVVGRDGHTLREAWGADNPRAYLGMTAPGFPNLFFMYGPNANLGHGGSFIFLAEAQTDYIVDAVAKMLNSGARSIECRAEVHDAYNADLDAAHSRMVWTHPGMDTYYRNSQGRVVSTMPWRVVDYWGMTRHADFADYIVRH